MEALQSFQHTVNACVVCLSSSLAVARVGPLLASAVVRWLRRHHCLLVIAMVWESACLDRVHPLNFNKLGTRVSSSQQEEMVHAAVLIHVCRTPACCNLFYFLAPYLLYVQVLSDARVVVKDLLNPLLQPAAQSAVPQPSVVVVFVGSQVRTGNLSKQKASR